MIQFFYDGPAIILWNWERVLPLDLSSLKKDTAHEFGCDAARLLAALEERND